MLCLPAGFTRQHVSLLLVSATTSFLNFGRDAYVRDTDRSACVQGHTLKIRSRFDLLFWET